MITFPCPWCDQEVALIDQAVETSVRCDACATMVDLSPVSPAEAAAALPIAA